MHSLSFDIRYRPLRLAWCFQPDDFEALRKTIRQNFTLWGGSFNPFVIVDDARAAREVVDKANVDFVLALTEEGSMKAFIDGFEQLPRGGIFDSSLFNRYPNGFEEPIFLDILTSARHRERLARENPATDKMDLACTVWDSDDPLRDLCAITFGELPLHDEPGATLLTLVQGMHTASSLDLTRGRPFQKLSTTHGFRYLSSRALENDLWSRQRPVDAGCFIGSATNFLDLVNYWNLRAAGHAFTFFDPEHEARLRPRAEQWLDDLASRNAPTTMLISRSRSGTDIGWTKHQSHVYELSEGERLSPSIPLRYFPEQSALATVGPARKTVAATIPLPAPPFPVDRYQPRRVAVTLRAGWASGLGDTLTFRTPFVRDLNVFYGRSSRASWYSARVEERGLAIVDELLLDSLDVQALPVAGIFEELFKSRGIKAEPSQAGLVTSRVISQLGGVDSCRALRVAGLRKLIESTKPEGSFTRSHAIQTIRDKKPDGSIGFDQYKSLYIEPRERGALKPEDVFAQMLRRGVFRVGLQFRCSECSLDAWVSLDHAKTNLECEFCGKVYDVTSQLRDRDWRYRRSGVFGKNDSQEGAVPVALTLLRLAHMTTELLYVPAMKLTAAGADIPDCETDFAAIETSQMGSQRSPRLAIGECKTRQPITGDDVSNLKAVATVCEAAGIETYVVFAKLESFSPDEIDRIKTVNSASSLRAIVLTPRELDGWFAYERRDGKRLSDRSLSGLAEATNFLYLQKAD